MRFVVCCLGLIIDFIVAFCGWVWYLFCCVCGLFWVCGLHCCALALLCCVAGCLALVAGGVFCAPEVGCFVMWVGLVMGCLVCGVVVWV